MENIKKYIFLSALLISFNDGGPITSDTYSDSLNNQIFGFELITITSNNNVKVMPTYKVT
jgi:hypothetical protein